MKSLVPANWVRVSRFGYPSAQNPDPLAICRMCRD
jgi:hypothetical protein